MNLVYAATKRCPCGAGLAYEKDGESGVPISGYWDCSAILLGEAIPSGAPGSVQHTARLPFVFYEIKGENQPSARERGETTRPLAGGQADKEPTT
jgi:hypothetical protein